MFSDKKNILQLAALLPLHGVRKVVMCPGSRNIPLVQTLNNVPGMRCYPVTDERSAGFFALGLALEAQEPVAVCCTSGSALLNLHPAVAEACYQQIPLLVISADRPQAWIGQMDGQTLPQPGVFGTLVRKSVTLPEATTAEEEWYCNRLINEALLELDHHGRGPVHINVPVSDPFFQHPVTELPEVRVIRRIEPVELGEEGFRHLAGHLNGKKVMVIVGQMERTGRPEAWPPVPFLWLTENLSNGCHPAHAVTRLEPLLASLDEEEMERLRPDIVLTTGGHIISKRLKRFLRQHPPVEHWHIAPDGQVADLYQHLTTVIEMDSARFFGKLFPYLQDKQDSWREGWLQRYKAIAAPEWPYSEMGAIARVQRCLPEDCVLHLANSSVVRYAQMEDLPQGVLVRSNRGVNGIEGSLSTAIGHASASERLNFLFIGDLSFFYDMNGLWNGNYGSNIRILLLNNGGGEIFGALPGLELQEKASPMIMADHETSAKAWAEDRGWHYLSAHDAEGLEAAVQTFTAPATTDRPLLLEVFTDRNSDVQAWKEYFAKLQNKEI